MYIECQRLLIASTACSDDDTTVAFMGAGASAAAPTSYNQFVTIDVTAVPSSPSCMAMATFYWSVYRSVKCPSLRPIYFMIGGVIL